MKLLYYPTRLLDHSLVAAAAITGFTLVGPFIPTAMHPVETSKHALKGAVREEVQPDIFRAYCLQGHVAEASYNFDQWKRLAADRNEKLENLVTTIDPASGKKMLIEKIDEDQQRLESLQDSYGSYEGLLGESTFKKAYTYGKLQVKKGFHKMINSATELLSDYFPSLKSTLSETQPELCAILTPKNDTKQDPEESPLKYQILSAAVLTGLYLGVTRGALLFVPSIFKNRFRKN